MNDGKFRNEKSLTVCHVRAQVHDDAFTRRYFYFAFPLSCSPTTATLISSQTHTNTLHHKTHEHHTIPTSHKVNNLVRAMAPTRVHPPPEAAHSDCPDCDEHFLSVATQADRGCRYRASLVDFDAEQLLRAYQNETKENLKHVKALLASHGDAIWSRWSQYSQQKRQHVLANASQIITTASSKRGSWAESKNDLIKWLELESLSQGTKLLSLLHLRTEYEPHLWAAFDTRSSYLCFFLYRNDEYLFNAKSVIMYGKHYGKMKRFDVNSAHGWAEAGFPRAVVTFQAQYQISILLKGAADLLTAGVMASGNSTWTSLVSRGLHDTRDGVSWGAYHNQEFAPPTHFDPNVLLEKARDHLNLLIDEVELMQTDPEYFQQYINDVKTSTHTEQGESTETAWQNLAREISLDWTNDIGIWQRIVAECENLKKSFARHGMDASPGTRLTQDTDTAVRCFGETIRQWLMGIAHNDFVCLRRLASMQKSFKKLGKDLNINQAHLEKVLDPTVQTDRVLMGALTIQTFAMINSTSGISARVDKLRDELGGLTYSKGVARWLSGMALLDEMYGSWYWRQMTDYHDPLDEGAVRLDINSRDMLCSSSKGGIQGTKTFEQRKAADVQCGQLMRSFSGFTLPKGVKNRSWFTKMTEARERLHEVWQHIRTVFSERQSSIGRSELFITSIISQMSFDESPEYLARVAAERQEIEQKFQRDSMLGKVPKPLSFQPSWDSGANKDMAVRRNLTRKTNASRDDGTIEKDLEQLTLSNNVSLEDDDHQSTSASAPQIAVKQETLSIVSKMFTTRAESVSGVRWTTLVQGLTDAGLAVTQGAGSAVTFANEQGAVSIHQPHDRDGSNVDAIMLRGLGRRFNKWFGWTSETFVLREKGDKKS